MTFSSILFLYFFLPVFMGIYGICKPEQRAKILMLGSCFFTAWKDHLGLINLFAAVLLAYIGGILIYNFRTDVKKSRILLGLCCAVNAAMLITFSYSGFSRTGLFGLLSEADGRFRLYAAFGVTVYTLHSISYCTDIYRGLIKPEIKFSCVFSYVGFMPSLICGPLVRFGDISDGLRSPQINSQKLSDGILLFMFGLSEKVIISNQLGALWKDIALVGTDSMSLVTAWLALFVFGFWFYFEFLSFSHMARGFALMLGFEVNPNFRHPFAKKTVRDFCSSFNISLNRWAEDYIYLSFGKSKISSVAAAAKMLLCALAVGLWYGTGINFVLWTVFIALLILAENSLKSVLSRIPSVIRFIMTQLTVLFSWSVLAGRDLHETFGYIRAMFRWEISSGDNGLWYWLRSSFLLFGICILLASPLLKTLYSKLNDLKFSVISFSKPMIILALLILCTAFMVSGNSRAAFAF